MDERRGHGFHVPALKSVASFKGQGELQKNPFVNRKKSPRSLEKEESQNQTWMQRFTGDYKTQSKSNTPGGFSRHQEKVDSKERAEQFQRFKSQCRENSQDYQKEGYQRDKPTTFAWGRNKDQKQTQSTLTRQDKSPFSGQERRMEFGQKHGNYPFHSQERQPGSKWGNYRENEKGKDQSPFKSRNQFRSEDPFKEEYPHNEHSRFKPPGHYREPMTHKEQSPFKSAGQFKHPSAFKQTSPYKEPIPLDRFNLRKGGDSGGNDKFRSYGSNFRNKENEAPLNDRFDGRGARRDTPSFWNKDQRKHSFEAPELLMGRSSSSLTNKSNLREFSFSQSTSTGQRFKYETPEKGSHSKTPFSLRNEEKSPWGEKISSETKQSKWSSSFSTAKQLQSSQERGKWNLQPRQREGPIERESREFGGLWKSQNPSFMKNGTRNLQWPTSNKHEFLNKSEHSQLEMMKQTIKYYEDNPEMLMRRKEQRETEQKKKQALDALLDQLAPLAKPQDKQLERNVTTAHLKLLNSQLRDDRPYNREMDPGLVQVLRTPPSITQIVNLPPDMQRKVNALPLNTLCCLGPLIEISSINDVGQFGAYICWDIKSFLDHIQTLKQDNEKLITERKKKLDEAANELVDEFITDVKTGALVQILKEVDQRGAMSVEEIEGHVEEIFCEKMRVLLKADKGDEE